MGIKILLEEGPKPRKGAGGIVLASMEDIERARGLGWGWKEISKELGVESPQAVRKAYVRIKKRIDSGKLKVPGKDQQKNRKEERKEEKKEIPGSDRPVSAGKVKLIEGKVSKDGACEAFRRLPSID